MYTKRTPSTPRPTRPPMSQQLPPKATRPSGRGLGGRLATALVIAAMALFSFLSSAQENPITGETQYVALSQEQEIALGLQAQPEMIAEYGGLDPDQRLQNLVDEVGFKLVNSMPAIRNSGYQFEFNLLNDPETINAFALPGGPIFITTGLLTRLESEGQLAGVLGHEIGHVIARHGAQQMANQQLAGGLTGAVVAAAYDPNDPNSARTEEMLAVVANLVNMKYGRADELESDMLGVRIIASAGYDPRALIGVMQILAEASAGNSQPEFLSTHPDPGNRIGRIEEAIATEFPEGVPAGLVP